jgi:hypothetical protein
MIGRAFFWLAFLPLLVILIANPQNRLAPFRAEKPSSVSHPSDPEWVFQAFTETPAPESTPSRVAPRNRRPTPTPLPTISTQHNPGLVIGAVIVVAIILIGILRFSKS